MWCLGNTYLYYPEDNLKIIYFEILKFQNINNCNPNCFLVIFKKTVGKRI